MTEEERHRIGDATRRSVLGDAHVDRSLAGAAAYEAEFQDLLTRYAWGEIWSRPGLDHPTRRLLAVSMLIALNRADELRMHLRAALEHGVELNTLAEVILQSAIYCGLPAANAAFHLLRDVASAAGASRGDA